jgi:hypothetical protein
MIRRVLALIGIVGVAALLAFPLRYVIYDAVVVPAAYVWWILGLIYHAVHESVWWIVVLVLVLMILFRSLLPGIKPATKVNLKTKPVIGQVEGLAAWVKQSRRGIYFKWLIANRLGKIAYQILAQRETGRQRSVLEPLIAADWDPGDELRTYLESGLHGSFADFPYSKKPLSQPVPTPLDHDVSEAVEFLEMQVKN